MWWVVAAKKKDQSGGFDFLWQISDERASEKKS
jgi:hypothetical protein